MTPIRTTITPMNAAQIAEHVTACGYVNPRKATITRDVKTKGGIAFKKGDALVTVYEAGTLLSQEISYVAYSIRTHMFTAIPQKFLKFGV